MTTPKKLEVPACDAVKSCGRPTDDDTNFFHTALNHVRGGNEGDYGRCRCSECIRIEQIESAGVLALGYLLRGTLDAVPCESATCLQQFAPLFFVRAGRGRGAVLRPF